MLCAFSNQIAVVSTSIDGWTISSSTWTSVFIDVIAFNLGLEKVIQIEWFFKVFRMFHSKKVIKSWSPHGFTRNFCTEAPAQYKNCIWICETQHFHFFFFKNYFRISQFLKKTRYLTLVSRQRAWLSSCFSRLLQLFAHTKITFRILKPKHFHNFFFPKLLSHQSIP